MLQSHQSARATISGNLLSRFKRCTESHHSMDEYLNVHVSVCNQQLSDRRLSVVCSANSRLSEDQLEDWLLNMDSNPAQRCSIRTIQGVVSSVGRRCGSPHGAASHLSKLCSRLLEGLYWSTAAVSPGIGQWPNDNQRLILYAETILNNNYFRMRRPASPESAKHSQETTKSPSPMASNFKRSAISWVDQCSCSEEF